MKKIGLIFFYLIVSSVLVGQNQKEVKLRIILVNPDTLIHEKEEGKLHTAYIYHKDKLIKTINIDSLLTTPYFNNIIKYEFFLPKNTYSIIIEGCFDYPIIVTELVMIKRLFYFLPLDFNEIAKTKVTTPKVLIIDYRTNLDKELEKNFTISKPYKE